MNAAASLVEEAADEDANIIFGSVIDETLGDQVRITVIATGSEEMAAVRSHSAAATDAVPSDVERERVRQMLEGARSTNEDAVVVQVSEEEPVLETTSSNPNKKASPKVFNPFAQGNRSEYDIPAFARRGNAPRELMMAAENANLELDAD